MKKGMKVGANANWSTKSRLAIEAGEEPGNRRYNVENLKGEERNGGWSADNRRYSVENLEG
jgi:hypothetical protein